jgi:hypothetical protein
MTFWRVDPSQRDAEGVKTAPHVAIQHPDGTLANARVVFGAAELGELTGNPAAVVIERPTPRRLPATHSRFAWEIAQGREVLLRVLGHVDSETR